MNLENNLTLKHYSQIINNLPYGILIVNKQGDIVLSNEKMLPIAKESCIKLFEQCSEFGIYSADKQKRYSVSDLPVTKAFLGKITKGEKLFLINSLNKEGIYIKMSAFPILEDGQITENVVVVFDDITQEQLLYESVICKINELEEYVKNSLTY